MTSSTLLSALVDLCITRDASYAYEKVVSDERTQAAITLLRHLHERREVSFAAPMDDAGTEFLGSFVSMLPSSELMEACVALGGPQQLARDGQPLTTTAFYALVQRALANDKAPLIATLVRLIPQGHPVLGAWDGPQDTFGGGLARRLLVHKDTPGIDDAVRALDGHGINLMGYAKGHRLARYLHRPESWAIAVEQAVDLNETGVDATYPQRPLWEVLVLDHIGLADTIVAWGAEDARVASRVEVARTFAQLNNPRGEDMGAVVDLFMSKTLWLEQDSEGRTPLMRAVLAAPPSIKVFHERSKKIPAAAWTMRDRQGRSLWFYAVAAMPQANANTLVNKKNQSPYFDAVEAHLPFEEAWDSEGRGLLWQMARQTLHTSQHRSNRTLTSHAKVLAAHLPLEMWWSKTECQGQLDHWVALVERSLRTGKAEWFEYFKGFVGSDHPGMERMQTFLDSPLPASRRLTGLLRIMRGAFEDPHHHYHSSSSRNDWKPGWNVDATQPADYSDITSQMWEQAQALRQKHLATRSAGQQPSMMGARGWTEVEKQVALRLLAHTLPVQDAPAVSSRPRL